MNKRQRKKAAKRRLNGAIAKMIATIRRPVKFPPGSVVYTDRGRYTVNGEGVAVMDPWEEGPPDPS